MCADGTWLLPSAPLADELKKNGAATFPYPQLTDEGEMVDANEKPPPNHLADAVGVHEDEIGSAVGARTSPEEAEVAERVTPSTEASLMSPEKAVVEGRDSELDEGVASMRLSSTGGAEVLAAANGTYRYFVPLRLACETKHDKIVEIALDCIQKLIAYGYVRGKVVQVGSVKKSMMDMVMETICSCKDQEEEGVQRQIVKAVLTAVTSTVSVVHDTTLLLAVKSCFYIFLVSKSAAIQSTAKATLVQMLNVVFQRVESFSQPVIQRDAFLVFRSLCKLSMKPLPEAPPSEESIELRSKLLSLQMLNTIVQNSGDKFRSGEKFIWAIRQYLCLSLLKNGVSPNPAILQLSLDIFVTLIRYFKNHLKSEIGVFFSNILLRILESSNSSGQQKLLTVQSLRVLVREPQLIVDLFLNYDCDLEGRGIFTSMCDVLSRVALSSQSLTETSDQDATLKSLALETLVGITDSMVLWEREGGHEASGGSGEPVAAEGSVASPPAEGEPPSPAQSEGGAGGAADDSSRHSCAALVLASESGGRGQAVDFEAMFHRKHEVQEGVVKFNMKPKRGIRYLIEVCGLEETPASVCKFLLETQGLDKRSVGDYLGEGDDFNKQVLYIYVDSLDFGGMSFDNALRNFLSRFWLPGEAQKIDRMMEKFAERFCALNPGVFANTDTAYVLAFSLIMLNTDAHSAQMKKKMTQQEFVNMNRGINDSGDLPTELLESLYQNITTNEIKIKDETMMPGGPPPSSSSSSSRPSKSKLFHMESANMVKESQELFKAKARKKSVYYSSRNAEHARPMFEASWCALLAACSSVMEDANEIAPPIVGLTLRGFANAIHVAAEFGMATERDAFVTMLAKYTYLESTKTMGRRNIESFKTLVNLALTRGNSLGASWAQVLKCLSEFQRLHMIGTGAKTDSQIFFPSTAATTGGALADGSPASTKLLGTAAAGGAANGASATPPRPHAIILQPSRPRGSSSRGDMVAVDTANSHNLVQQVDVVAIDRIFSASELLNADAIVDFVTHLCNVSRDELASASDPQVYALQKIVEVAYYNMSRVRLVWARIWEVLGDFFTEVGQHPNLSIAMYALDSLRQLATKFLEKGELLNYQFQREFLKPFHDLMSVSESPEIKDLILNCLGNMMQTRAKSIRSGWTTLFKVFELAAAERSAPIVRTGFELVRRTIAKAESDLRDGEHQLECVTCLSHYLAQQNLEPIALRSIEALAQYAHAMLSTEAAAAAAAAAAASEGGASACTKSRIWWQLLSALAESVRNDARPQVRAASLTALFEIFTAELGSSGALRGDLGLRVFKELVLPIFDGTPLESEAPLSDGQLGWLHETGIKTLVQTERAFCAVHTQLYPLLDELIALLVRCLSQHHYGALAHAAAEALLHLVRETGANFSQETWALVCAEFKSCFPPSVEGEMEAPPPKAVGGSEMNGPSPLLREVSAMVEADAPPGSGPHELQVLLLSTVFQLLQSMYPLMKVSDVDGLLSCIHSMYDKAHRVVLEALSGEELTPTEIEEASSLKLESMGYYLQVLFALSSKLQEDMAAASPSCEEPELGSDEHIHLLATAAEYRLMRFCPHALRDYLRLNELASEPAGATTRLAGSMLKELTPRTLALLKGVLKFEEAHFCRALPALYPLFVELLNCESKAILGVLRELFAQRVGPVLQKQQGQGEGPVAR